MGLFSGGSKDWEREFDARLSDSSVKKDVMDNMGFFKPRETRVADDEGIMRRRNGEVCCGCGKGSTDHHTATPHSNPHPKVTNPRAVDKEDPPRRGFLGIF